MGTGGATTVGGTKTRIAAAASGVVAAGSGVAAGELVAGFLSPTLTPVTAVGGWVIDLVPPGVKDWAIALFGTADKAALLVGMALVITLLAAVAGLVEYRWAGGGSWLVAAAGALGLAAVLTRAQATMIAPVAPVAATVVTIAVLRALIGRLRVQTAEAMAQNVPSGNAGSDENEARDAVPPTTSRRSFARAFGLAAVLAAAGGAVAAVVHRAASVAAEVRGRLSLPTPASPATPIPAGAELGLEGMPPLVTPNGEFYRIDTALAVPTLNPDEWTLKVTGMVDREVTIDFATLLGKPLVERYVTIACVSNEVGGQLIGNARWLGWPVRELLQQAGPKPGADMVLSTSSDGFTAGTPLEALTDSRDALLAIGMNGEPLPLEHGFPVRLVVPGLYGFVSATKWLTTLKVTRFADDVAYWTPRGWSDHGPIKTQSRIDVPRAGRALSAGTVHFGGIAWAQHRGIARVELRINRGPWQQAVLAPGISQDTWYQWQFSTDLGRGDYEVQVRATDSTGTPQAEERRAPAPDGATGYHTLSIKVG
ncbi:molybdopterin-dependent oxidoreductase [Arthrobacter sp. M4]|uniref:molybdopterin-dependent oxidoreductase n=1 Tax=Arthrobacter sp. M4 TaxID=218160 RepID=UPI001CDCB071|nr:molybdopterin-dependent oxidoreductase [Arthrobacter sp. M4]MCA4134631.1 molybdopterin-dependent oxidoreductase [Arthrobacter sp. M4]